MTDATTREQTSTIDHWVDGTFWAGGSTRTAPVFNPAWGTVQHDVRLASVADVDHAVASASA